jgi:hypothetical protein
MVKEGFGESIPTVVIPVYSVILTIAGEASLLDATHLGRLPKTLTFPFRRQVRQSFERRGLRKNREVCCVGSKERAISRTSSPQKFFAFLRWRACRSQGL